MGFIITETKTSSILRVSSTGTEKEKHAWVSFQFFDCLCPSELGFTQSSTPWAIAARLVQIYIIGLGKRSPVWTKTITAHAVPGGKREVIVPSSQILRPPPRLHSRNSQGILRNQFQTEFAFALCKVLIVSPSQAVLLRGPLPSHWSLGVFSMKAAAGHVNSWS